MYYEVKMTEKKQYVLVSGPGVGYYGKQEVQASILPLSERRNRMKDSGVSAKRDADRA